MKKLVVFALVAQAVGACGDDSNGPVVTMGKATGSGGGGAVAGLDAAGADLVAADAGAGAGDAAGKADSTEDDPGPIFLDAKLPDLVLPPPDAAADVDPLADVPNAGDAQGQDVAPGEDGGAPDTASGDTGSSDSGNSDMDASQSADDAVLQGCFSAKDCPAGWECVKTPVGKICAEPACVPTGFELCNGVDDDCNGAIDDGNLCDDANVCTADSCGGKPGCKQTLPPAGTTCEIDGNPCTADVCAALQCVAGKEKNCDDGNPCTFDLCSGGNCSHKPQGLTGCDDGNPCTLADKCVQGVCQPGAPAVCNDGNPCTDDVCFPSTGKCLQANSAAGVPCNDGNACTLSDQCGLGQCAGKPANCDDGNPCTADTCAPQAGCQHSAANGTPCNDNNACTIGDICKSGVCGGGQAACDDANPCTLDGCNPNGGCTHSPIVGACSDNNLCTKGETCGPDGCKGGVSLICSDGNPCTNDACDPQLGCTYAPNNAPCTDGNPCTLDDKCNGGTCAAASTVNCNDNVACTADTCDIGLGGCLHTPKVEACDDGDICTVDQCLTATGCKHTLIEKCCGGKTCAASEVCIQYPDTLQPFCAKPCNSGNDCPGSCCHMTFKTKHCLVNPYLDECCGTPEYWPTDSEPYGCGVGGKGTCVNYPNPQPPYYPSKITYCTTPCKVNADCPQSCCGLTTMGNQQCVNPAYKNTLCPKM